MENNQLLLFVCRFGGNRYRGVIFFFSRFTMDVDFGEATDCIQMPAHNIDA